MNEQENCYPDMTPNKLAAFLKKIQPDFEDEFPETANHMKKHCEKNGECTVEDLSKKIAKLFDFLKAFKGLKKEFCCGSDKKSCC